MNVVVFRSPWRQALGLMFRRAAPGTLYVFDFGREVRHGFHMWFVLAPIDLYLLDAKRKVLETKRGFRPFTAYTPKGPYRYAVETATGLLRLKQDATLNI